MGENVIWRLRDGKTDRSLLKKLPDDPATPLLGIDAEEMKIPRGTCTPRFTDVAFIGVKTQKPSTGQGGTDKGDIYAHSGGSFSSRKERDPTCLKQHGPGWLRAK